MLGSPLNSKGTKLWNDRKWTNVAHALILFNVYGIPLSYGPYLEYYYNTDNGHLSLVQASMLMAVQLACLFLPPIPIAWLYRDGLWRGCVYTSTAVLGLSQASPLFLSKSPLFLGLRGLAQGLCLGTLWAVSTLSVASHYRNNIPLASTMSTSAGLLGALVYTALASKFLSSSAHKLASTCNLALTLGTLIPAALGLKPYRAHLRLKIHKYKRPAHPFFEDKPSVLFCIGFALVSAAILVYPTFLVLMLSTSTPHPLQPQNAASPLLVMYALAIPSATLSSSRWLRTRLGPVNTFIAASLLAGSASIVPAWIPRSSVAVAAGCVYGVCFGAVMALGVRVLFVVVVGGRGKYVVRVFVGAVLIAVGVCAAVGVVGISLCVQRGGWEMGGSVAGAVVCVGGLVMGVARWWGGGGRVWAVI